MKAIDAIEEMLRNGELSRALNHLHVLPIPSGLDELAREPAIHRGRFLQLAREYRQGLVKKEDHDVGRARLTDAVLRFLDELRAVKSYGLDSPQPRLEQPSGKQVEKIIGGTSRLVPVAWLEEGLACSRAVCRVVTPSGPGSGFLIAGSRLVTNVHVIASQAVLEATFLEFGYQEDTRGKILAPVSYPLSRARLLHADVDKDVSVVDLSAVAPDLNARWGTVQVAEEEVQKGDCVSIIQHPDGGPKQVAVTENRVVAINKPFVQYTTDTLPGSSGSPVFDKGWKLVAIHRAGGDRSVDRWNRTHYVNEGCLASAVDELLRG